MEFFKNDNQLYKMRLRGALDKQRDLTEEGNSLKQQSSELWKLATEFHNTVSWSILMKKFEVTAELTLKLTES